MFIDKKRQDMPHPGRFITLRALPAHINFAFIFVFLLVACLFFTIEWEKSAIQIPCIIIIRMCASLPVQEGY